MSEKGWEGRRGESVSFFCSTSLCPQSRPLLEKPFLLLKRKCQNIKSCSVGGFPMLNIFVRLCARSQMIDVSVKVKCCTWPIIGYTRSWYTGMRYWKQWLQAPCLFPTPTWFSRSFSQSSFPTTLEPGTGLISTLQYRYLVAGYAFFHY